MLESKRRAIIFLVISFLLAIAAGVFFLDKVKAINTELGGMTKIYVASTDIPSRTLIQPDQVETLEIPNRFLNDSHVTNVKKLVNKVLVVPVSKGDILTKNMIKPLSSATNENNRLVTLQQTDRLRFDDSRLEGLDRVDIIVSHQFDDQTPKTEIFMKDVPVASVIKSGKKFIGVMVEVSAEQAPKLIHMQNYADSIRILKANVGKGEQNPAKEAPKETAAEPEQKEVKQSGQPVKSSAPNSQEAAKKEEAEKAKKSAEAKDNTKAKESGKATESKKEDK